MSTAVSEMRPWTKQRWITAVVVVFGLHLVFLFGFQEENSRQGFAVRTEPVFQLGGEISEDVALSLTDPTLYALPNWHGFSGAAWVQGGRLEYEMSHWSEAPRWLSASPSELGDAFHQFVAQELKEEFMADLRIAVPRPEPGLSVEPARTGSELRVRGGVAGRSLLSSPDLPVWPHGDILTNTVVQVMVNSMGRTVSSVLLSSSGLKRADERALEIARELKFEKRELEEIGFGELIFEWHTVGSEVNEPLARQ